MKKLGITTTSFAEYAKEPLNLLKGNGFEVSLNPYGRKLKKDEILEVCEGASGIIAGTEIIDADVMRKLPNLKVISRCGSGLDNVDRTCAEKLGIKIVNTPDGPTLAVAELTVGLLLNLLRKVNRMDATIRDGKWKKLMGSLLYGKKAGIIGFGRIGKKVAKLLKGFGCEIVYTDPFLEDGLLGLRRLSLEELLSWADIISLHVSESNKILGEEQFRLIKKGVWLINVSRGQAIDESVLYKYLKNGYLSGAAIDVFTEEPYRGKFIELDNIILTPHIGSYAREARIEMEKQAAENLLRSLKEIK